MEFEHTYLTKEKLRDLPVRKYNIISGTSISAKHTIRQDTDTTLENRERLPVVPLIEREI